MLAVMPERTADGLASLLDLVDAADVFVHSFSPGVVEKLGVGPAAPIAAGLLIGGAIAVAFRHLCLRGADRYLGRAA